MLCAQITDALAQLSRCTVTVEGSRVTTQCLYPSFEPVQVFVAGYGEGFKVHDGGGAIRSAWDHGRDISFIRRMLTRQAVAHQLRVVEDALVAEVSGPDWLVPAVLSVANASSAAAFAVVEHSATASDEDLRRRIMAILATIIPERYISKGFELSGRSGKKYTFDFALRRTDDEWLLIDAVSPHHVSIAAKYVAFSDTSGSDHQISGRFAVYDRPLEPDDAELIKQVADLIPFNALSGGVRRRELVN
jgi:hypothetical protein